MSKQSNYARFKNAFGKAFLVTIIALSVSQTNAQSPENTAAAVTGASVNYLGTQDDMYLFRVQYYNAKKNKFIVEIRESTGNVLFKESYNEKAFSKSFKIPKDLEGKLSFVLRSPKENLLEIFEVNTIVRISDVVVTKL